MNLFLKTCALLLLWSQTAQPARILSIFPTPAYSHYAAGVTILKELARKGHEVTVISAFPQKTPLKNFRDIELEGVRENFEKQRTAMNFFEIGDGSPILQDFFISSLALNVSKKVLEHPAVQKLLHSEETFDAVILEEFMCYSLKGLSYRFNASLISFSSIGTSRFMNEEIGNPAPSAYIPDTFLAYIPPMSFFQRLYNSFVYLAGTIIKHAYILPAHNRILQEHLPGAPHLSQINYNISLAIVNSHVSTHQPVPHVPVVVDVGGVHVEPPQPLPKDLQEFLDGAKDGAIFFSMGSNLRSKEMPAEKRDMFLRTFAKLKQKVLWKWEDDNLPGKPENVMIRKWLPQNDVLAHPNVKIFISHGGLLSTIESVYHGVPIVGLPVYGDQKMNLGNSVNNGFALSVPYTELTEEKFTAALREMLTNPKYTKNAKQRSRIMHDQPLKPLDKAVFWIEYVLRHKGAPHLRVAALDLSWYQYFLLDVIAFVLVTMVVALLIIRRIIRKFCKCPGKCSKSKGKKKKD